MNKKLLEKPLWSDKIKIELLGHKDKCVQKSSGETFKSKNTMPTNKHGGNKIMLWGCFATGGNG